MTVSKESIKNIYATSALIDKHSKEIAQTMYFFMFTTYPEAKELFRNAPANQHEVLAETISAIAVNINNLDVFMPAINKIAYTHVRVGIKPNHYPYVTNSILHAFESVLEDKLQNISMQNLLDSWREAINYVSHLLIKEEKKIYEELKNH